MRKKHPLDAYRRGVPFERYTQDGPRQPGLAVDQPGAPFDRGGESLKPRSFDEAGLPAESLRSEHDEALALDPNAEHLERSASQAARWGQKRPAREDVPIRRSRALTLIAVVAVLLVIGGVGFAALLAVPPAWQPGWVADVQGWWTDGFGKEFDNWRDPVGPSNDVVGGGDSTRHKWTIEVSRRALESAGGEREREIQALLDDESALRQAISAAFPGSDWSLESGLDSGTQDAILTVGRWDKPDARELLDLLGWIRAEAGHPRAKAIRVVVP